jgi:uncharacterized delta-60 repeat protein
MKGRCTVNRFRTLTLILSSILGIQYSSAQPTVTKKMDELTHSFIPPHLLQSRGHQQFPIPNSFPKVPSKGMQPFHPDKRLEPALSMPDEEILRRFRGGQESSNLQRVTDGVQQEWLSHYGSRLFPGATEATAVAVDVLENVYVTGTCLSEGIGTDYVAIKYDAVGAEQWVARYDGPAHSSDFARSIAVDASGNVYVTGFSSGLTSFLEFATIKYNSAGVEQWVSRYNTPENSYGGGQAIAVDASGNVYVTGVIGSIDSSDYLTLKYNAAGVKQWAAFYNGPGNAADNARAVAVDGWGNVYVTGTSGTIKYSSSGVQQWIASGAAVALALDSSGNVYVTGTSGTIKYSSSGVQQWIASGAAVALALDSSGNVYVRGTSSTSKYNSSGAQQWIASGGGSAFGTTLGLDAVGNVYVQWTLSGQDSFVAVKYNPAGVEQWVARHNGRAYASAVDMSGNLHVVGNRIYAMAREYLTVKYNAAGLEQWTALYTGPGSSFDFAWSLALDGSGNVYVTGASLGRWGGRYYDFATVKYNAAGVRQWAARYNGPGDSLDLPYGIAVDPSGNVYVTGYSYSSSTSYDYATVKYNAAGVEQWVARYNGPENSYDFAWSLALDGLGNVYIAGTSWSSSTGYDYAIIKYDGSGVQQWVARYNGPGNATDDAWAVAVDRSGNVYVTGQSYGSGTGYDYATVKYNSSGVEQWAARYNGPGNSRDGASALFLDPAGNVYVTGSSGASNDYDYITIKYDNSGTENWIARYDSPGDDGRPVALAVDGSGNVCVTGYSGSRYYSQYVTLKYDAAGIEQWAARYGGNSYNSANSLALDNQGNVYVTGMTDYYCDEGCWGGDFTTIKYSTAGVEQWIARYDGAEDEALAIAVDASGNVYVTGSSFDGESRAVYTTIKYSQTTTGVKQVTLGMPEKYSLEQNYPNPFNPATVIRYSLPVTSYTTLKIYNVLGQEVATLVNEMKQLGSYEVTWDASGMASGVYLYRLQAGNYIDTKKLILLK